MIELEQLLSDLPDPESARRFLSTLEEQRPAEFNKLTKNDGLLSDVLTLAAYSPLLATTLLQNPEYLWWLNRKRRAPAVRTKEELLEALGRFGLTNSQLDLHAQLARFRRRELLRIFLSDIRRLTTMAEITEDISNLADAILETALRRAEQDTSNRYGSPLIVDEKGRKTPAGFCIVSLGKLGSRELNYSSDIDLLFLYSDEGETSGTGSRGVVTNREYFIKLSESIVQLVGKQAGEGAAYRVDMRLRPHGRVGPLAISVADAIRYYTGEARDWERQVLIRSRASAGQHGLYKMFFEQVEPAVFSADVTVATALENVRRSKVLIDQDSKMDRGFNVKLGRGGIREIEFIAQALQLAYGGRDRWLRASHTLISLSRLADRSLISEGEQTELFNAYEFLRHLEHVLQMENGLQTHNLPDERDRRELIGRRMGFDDLQKFDAEVEAHASNVHRIFERVFGPESIRQYHATELDEAGDTDAAGVDAITALERPARATAEVPLSREEYIAQLTQAIDAESRFRDRLGVFRRSWSRLVGGIKNAELDGRIDMRKARRAQTALAEASIDTALGLTLKELKVRFKTRIERLPIAVIGLGKLGGGSVDYESDLDVVLVHGQGTRQLIEGLSDAEFFSRAAELFVTVLSSMTRDGSIYRVDLRLRPYGKNGQSVISDTAFADYMRHTAAIWEWLAYVKIRAVAGEIELARSIETQVRGIIHSRAASTPATELATETLRVRKLLETEKGGGRRSKDIDIKYGPGGILDVYFAMRYLQLRDNIPDRPDDRSTETMLADLRERGSIDNSEHEVILAGYRFLSTLDHVLRLTVGRTTRLPVAQPKILDAVADRMGLGFASELHQQLTIHRLNLRKAFTEIVS